MLNIKNEDDKCALWCILAHLFPKHNRNDQTSQIAYPNAYEKQMKDIITTGVEFPLKIQDVGKLEQLNNLAINIFTLEGNDNVIPVRISDNNEVIDKKRLIDLLYIVNGVNTHYCLITNLALPITPVQTICVADVYTFVEVRNRTKPTLNVALITTLKNRLSISQRPEDV